MMQLLSGHSLTVADSFQPETMSLQLTERTSTATMTLDDNAPDLAVGDWLRADNGPGIGIVWRVKSIDTQYEKNTRTVMLEHVIATLKDNILFGEIKPEDISGGTTATAEQAVSYILNRQSDWVIGTMQRTATKPYTFNGDTLFSALELVSSTLTECVWEYNFSSYPFTLNMMSIDNNAASEMRMDRNIRTLKRTIDRSRMYTRFYPIGKNNLHISGDYVSKNENLYGVISKTETDQSKETASELYDWAMDRLEGHCNPYVTVTISGEDLSASTGEPLDSFTIGKYCRIPLPEFGTYIMERVTKLNYPDVIHDQETVTVTLANELPDIASVYRQEVTEKIAKSGRTHAKNGADDHAWMVDTDEHIGLVAEAVAGEGADHDWSRVASVMVDGQGVHQRVTYAENQIVQAWSSIEMTENAITSEVARASSEEGLLRSEIVQTASMIRSEVHNTLSEFYTEIIQTASSIVIRTGTDTKTFHQNTAPVGTQEDPLVDGDVWFDSEGQFIWADAADKSWLDDSSFDWGKLKESDVHRYDGVNNEWVKVLDGKALMQDTKYDQNREYIQIVAGRVDVTNGEVQSYRAEFKAEADQIRANVTEQVNGLSSTITQTASQIRSEVNDKANGLRSSITQTASQIRSEVSNAKSQLASSITQQADRISLVVEGTGANAHIKPASIVAAINNGESSVVISANHVNLDGYVSATNFSTVLANLYSAHIQRLYVDSNIYGPNGNSLYTLGLMNVSISSSGNTYTLKQTTLNGTETTIGTFSRAVSSWTMGWSNGVLTATANPQNQSCTTNIYQGSASWSGRTVTIPILAVNSSNPNLEVNTGRSVTATYSGGGGSISSIGLISTQAGPSAVSGYTWAGSLSKSSGNMWLKIELSSGDKVYYDVT